MPQNDSIKLHHAERSIGSTFVGWSDLYYYFVMKIAVIGIGQMGKRHAKLVSNFDRCQLVGLCDANYEAQQQLDGFNVPFYDSTKELLSSVQPDGVIIATPSDTHLEIMELCAAYGIHALI